MVCNVFLLIVCAPFTNGEHKNERCGKISPLPPGMARDGKVGIKAVSTS